MIKDLEFAYFLGMLTGRGRIDETEKDYVEIKIEIPLRNLEIEGMDVVNSINNAINDMKSTIGPLLEEELVVNAYKRHVDITMFKSKKSYLYKMLKEIVGNYNSYEEFRIPVPIFESNKEIKQQFLKGIADVCGHIRKSNNYMCKDDENCYNHRVYIEILRNWYLVIDIANLLMEIDIPVHNINWAHPNIRDPYLRDYNKGKRYSWYKEHQIKIFAEEFEKVGFNIKHKSDVLKILANVNRINWIKHKSNISKKREGTGLEISNDISCIHHKYYWETKEKKSLKPIHPMESDERIPEIIRGKHFNSWKEIARELGYPRKQK